MNRIRSVVGVTDYGAAATRAKQAAAKALAVDEHSRGNIIDVVGHGCLARGESGPLFLFGDGTGNIIRYARDLEEKR